MTGRRPGLGAAIGLVWALAAIGPLPSAGAAAPSIGAVWASTVQHTTAQLNAEVNPGGKSSSYRVDYIARASYDANLAAAKDGFTGASKFPTTGTLSVPGTVLTTIKPLLFGLSPDTAYRYRVVVSNVDGTTQGLAMGLATFAAPAPFVLPDGRGWELVSPVEKNGGQVGTPGELEGGDVLQASADGQAVTFGSAASFAGGGQGAPPASQYISRRSAAGWSTENASLGTLSGAYPDDGGSPYRLFSGDLARAVHLNVHRCAPVDPCPRDYYLRETSTGAVLASPQEADLIFAGASPDLGHVVVSTCAALTPDATEVPLGVGCDPAEPNLYLWSAGGLSLVNLLPAQGTGTPGAALAAESGAVSAGGGRVYFNDTATGDLYLRAGAFSARVDDDAPGGGGAALQSASADGALALYLKAGHLYRYEASGDASTDLTPAGGVQGVLGASPDLGRVYYLTAAGLFMRSGAATTKIAAAADAVNYPPATGSARVSADGTKLLFASTVALQTSAGETFDNTDLATGLPDSQLYLYDATGAGTLTCVSCKPTGARPIGPSSVPGAIANGIGPIATRVYKPRVLSADGRRVFFDSRDALVLSDVNLDTDVYRWQSQGSGGCNRTGGCVALISSGLAGHSSFADASADGSDAFFLTDRSLVGADPGSVDLYDARVGGGFPESAAPPLCLGDACQVVPPAPEDPILTTVLAGPGNPAERYRSYGAKAAGKCPKGKVRRKGKCVKRAKRHSGAKSRGGRR